MIFLRHHLPDRVLPGWMQSVAHWLPQTYIIDGMRLAILNGADFATLCADLPHPAGFRRVLADDRLCAVRRMERRARRNGAIGQF